MKVLVNATSHQQSQSQSLEWADPVIWADEGHPLAGEIQPDQPLHPQVMILWGKILERIDAENQAGNLVSGVMLAGYAPAVIGVAQQCRSFRLPYFVSVMAPPRVAPDGQKIAAAPAGVRWVRPYDFDPRRPTSPTASKKIPYPGIERCLHVAPRPLTGERQALIESFADGCSLVPAETTRSTPQGNVAAPALNPPPPQGNAAAESAELLERVRSFIRASNPTAILLDGAPIETALHIWAVSKDIGLPLYYLRTVPAPAPLFAQPVSIERMPY